MRWHLFACACACACVPMIAACASADVTEAPSGSESGENGSTLGVVVEGTTTGGELSATSMLLPVDETSADASSGAGQGSSSGGSGAGDEAGSSSTTGSPAPPPPPATYRVILHNTWSVVSHPAGVPELAHFSWLAGASHDETLELWAVGELASPGMVQMAETGVTDILVDEVIAAVDAGHAAQAFSWHQWFCPAATSAAACAYPVVEIEVDAAFPRVTLVTMVGPSPDLFVGVAGLSLLQDGAWVDELVVPLHPYDGGIRSDTDYTMNGALQDPPLPIVTIDSFEQHDIGPAQVGTMTFQRLDRDP